MAKKKVLELSTEEKLGAIDPGHTIAVTRQCELLGLAKSTYYYRPCGESEYNIMLTSRIDAIYTKCPFYGYPRITHVLKRDGYDVGYKRIYRLMALMGIQGVCPSKNLSYSGIKHRKISLSFEGNGYLISQSSVGNRLFR